MSVLVLYHYTCSHAAPEIVRDGYLIPNEQPLIPGRPALVWLTDLAEPDEHALGLTSTILSCKRTEHRFRVTVAPDVETFDEWADGVGLDSEFRWMLTDGREPEHWWVSAHPVYVIAAPVDDPSGPDDEDHIARPALGRTHPAGNRAP